MLSWIKHSTFIRKTHRKAFNVNARFINFVAMHAGRAKTSVKEEHKNRPLVVVTVAFNHVGLIEKQIELLRQNLTDEGFLHVVADNSPDKSCRRQIEQLCQEQHVVYVSVPPIIERCCWHRVFYGGISHGGALNWLYYHYLRELSPQRLALLDHDVFPLAPTSLCQSLGQRPFYGVKRIMEHGWYLWPGWCLFSFDFLLKHQPDFLPIYVSDSYLDAGGNNFFRLFQSFSPMKTEFPMVKTHRIKKTKGLTRHDEIYHGDCIQIIEGKWVHIINGSNCAHIPGKEKVVQKLLDNLDRLQPYTS